MFRLTLFLALLAIGYGAFAQNPVPALPGSPAGETINLKFPNADIKEVLDYYEILTGKRLVRDNQVIGQVNIVINQTLPKEDAIRIIEINLLMNGFSLVPADEKKNIWKVIGTGKDPRNFGIPIFSDANQLPDTEQIVSFLAKLSYADPTELATVLGQVVPGGVPGQAITPLPKAGALLISGNTVIIKSILKILAEIDLPPAEVVSEFFELKRADAKDVLEKLQDIIAPKGATGTPTATTPAVPRPNLARQQPAVTPDGLPAPQQPATVEVTGPNTIEVNAGRVLSEDAVVVGKTIIQADERTNRIHVITRPINLQRIFRKLIEQLDADTVFGEPVTRPLKFVSAGDILDAMKKAISDPGAKEDGGGAGGTRTTTNRGSTGTTQTANDSNRFGNNSGGFGNGGSGSGSTGGFSESLNTEERDVIPEAFTVGNTRIIADKRANAIIVIGNKDVQQKVFAFLDQIDVRAPQVEIRTVIGTLTLSDNEQFGFDYLLRKGGNLGVANNDDDDDDNNNGTNNSLVVNPGALVNPATLNISNLLTQAAVSQIGAFGASGISGFFSAGRNFDIILNALTSTNRFKVTAMPNIRTSNNKKAVISSGDEIAVPTSIQSSLGQSTTTGVVTNSNVQFKTVALQLEILPLVNADNEVALEIVQKVDEQNGTTRIDNNDIPRISSRSLKTFVTVPNGGTIVLGGLRRERENVARSGIPYLSKIPGLGALFRSTNKTKSREELVIMMQPIVTNGNRELIDQRERTMDGFLLEPDLLDSLNPKGTRTTTKGDKFRESAPVMRAEPVAKAKPARNPR